jgi:hypothetical protein
VFQEVTGLEIYNLKAAICDQTLGAMIRDEDEERIQQVERACAACMQTENPVEFLERLGRYGECQTRKEKRTRSRAMEPSIDTDEIQSPGFPLLTHLDLWLLHPSKIEQSASLARRIDACPYLDTETKQKALIAVWKLLYEEGKVFLNGNMEDSLRYEENRVLLYEYMIDKASPDAISTMIDFYHDIAASVHKEKRATSDEKEFVVLACQQTVLRLLIRAFGIGDHSVLYFIQNTQWPTDLVSHGATRDLTQWCNMILAKKVPVPSTLINEENNEVHLCTRFGSFDLNPAGVTPNESDVADTEAIPSIEAKKRTRDTGFEEELVARAEELAAHRSDRSEEGQDDHLDFDHDRQYVDVELYDRDRESDEEDVAESEEEVIVLDNSDDDGHSTEPVQRDQRHSEDDEYNADRHLKKPTQQEQHGHQYCDDAELDGEDEYSYQHENAYDREQSSEEEADHKGAEYHSYEQDEEEVDGNDDSNAEDSGETSAEDLSESSGDDVEVVEVAESDDASRYSGRVHEHESYERLEEEGSDDEQANAPESSMERGFPQAQEVVDLLDSDSDEEQDTLGEEQEHLFSATDTSPRRMDESVEALNENAETMSPEESARESFHRDVESANANSGAERQKEPVESDAGTDDEHERALPTEKAETDDIAVGGEFGATTDEEGENEKSNRVAQESRRADAVSGSGYNSQIENGYEPEDTHGFTEEDGSEAAHTEDEDEERRQAQIRADLKIVEHPEDIAPKNAFEADSQHVPHSSDDMDMADEHTELEEDLGAESSELEDIAEGATAAPRPILPMPPSETPKDATTLLEFAQKSQQHHDWRNHKSKEEDANATEEANLLSNVPAEDMIALAFDADDEDEIDATEGSRSLETEEEMKESENIHLDENIEDESVVKQEESNTTAAVDAREKMAAEVVANRSDAEIDASHVMESTSMTDEVVDQEPRGGMPSEQDGESTATSAIDSRLEPINDEEKVEAAEATSDARPSIELEQVADEIAVRVGVGESNAASVDNSCLVPTNDEPIKDEMEATKVDAAAASDTDLLGGSLENEENEDHEMTDTNENIVEETNKDAGEDDTVDSNSVEAREAPTNDQESIAIQGDDQGTMKAEASTKSTQRNELDEMTETNESNVEETNKDAEEDDTIESKSAEAREAPSNNQESIAIQGGDKGMMEAEESNKSTQYNKFDEFASDQVDHGAVDDDQARLESSHMEEQETPIEDEADEMKIVLKDRVSDSATIDDKGEVEAQPEGETNTEHVDGLPQDVESAEHNIVKEDGVIAAETGSRPPKLDSHGKDKKEQVFQNESGPADAPEGQKPRIDGAAAIQQEEKVEVDEESHHSQTLVWEKGDVVRSVNRRHFNILEDAKITSLNRDEDGNITCNLRFLVNGNLAKNIALKDVYPAKKEDDKDLSTSQMVGKTDDISSVGMNDEGSRPSRPSPMRRSKRRKSGASSLPESPGIPKVIHGTSDGSGENEDNDHDEGSDDDSRKATSSAVNDVTNISSPARRRRTTRSGASVTSAADNAELPTIPEASKMSLVGRPPRPKREATARSAASSVASAPRQSTRGRKPKKFDDASSLDDSVASRKSIRSNAKAQDDITEKAATKGTKFRIQEESTESAPNKRATRSRTKGGGGDSVVSEISTRSTRLTRFSTRRQK